MTPLSRSMEQMAETERALSALRRLVEAVETEMAAPCSKSYAQALDAVIAALSEARRVLEER